MGAGRDRDRLGRTDRCPGPGTRRSRSGNPAPGSGRPSAVAPATSGHPPVAAGHPLLHGRRHRRTGSQVTQWMTPAIGGPTASTSTAPAPRRASVMSGHWPRAGAQPAPSGGTGRTPDPDVWPRRGRLRQAVAGHPGRVGGRSHAWPKPPVARTTARAVTIPVHSGRRPRPSPAAPRRPSPGRRVRASRTAHPVGPPPGWRSRRQQHPVYLGQPTASPPACTMRGRLCPPSWCSAVRFSRAPRPARRWRSHRGPRRPEPPPTPGHTGQRPPPACPRRCRAGRHLGRSRGQATWPAGSAPADVLPCASSSTRRPACAPIAPRSSPPLPTHDQPRRRRSPSACGRGRRRSSTPVIPPCSPLASRQAPAPAPARGPRHWHPGRSPHPRRRRPRRRAGL